MEIKKWLPIISIILSFFIVTGCEADETSDNIEETKSNALDEVSENEKTTMNEEKNSTNESIDEEKQEEKNPDQNSISESSQEVEKLEELSVHFIDVGQADATLFMYSFEGEDYNVLFDTGNWNQNDVESYLNSQEITSLDIMIASHPHADHIGQMDLIIEEFNVDEVWMSGDTTSSQTFDRVLNTIESNDVDYNEPRAGDIFDIGPLTIQFFNPESLTGDLHEGSLAAKFTYGEVSFLLTGDAESQTEQAMLDRGYDLQADVLQLGHHGSKTSTSSEFLEVVSPTKAIISAGDDNSYGHPHDIIIERVLDAGVEMYSTIEHGTIIMETTGIAINTLTNSEGTISPSSSGGQSGDGSNDPQTDISEGNEENSSDDSATTDGCIDINDASIKNLQDIVHIGPARAEELIELRPFNTVKEMGEISGIAAGRLADITSENKACVGG